MNRRKFLRKLVAGAAVAAAAPHVPIAKLLAVTPPPVAVDSTVGITLRMMAFHKDAFAMMFEPTRLDVLYGMGTVAPDLACRVIE